MFDNYICAAHSYFRSRLTRTQRSIGLTTFLYANYWESGKGFLASYHDAFHEKPYVTSFVQWRWDRGTDVSKEQFDDGTRRLDVYSSWFLDEIIQQGKQFTLLVTPSEDVKPLYRWSTTTVLRATCLEPVVDLSYHGKHSYRPSAISLPHLGQRRGAALLRRHHGWVGADLQLIKYMGEFRNASGRPLRVNVGREMFERQQAPVCKI